jgi:hypothetical protein
MIIVASSAWLYQVLGPIFNKYSLNLNHECTRKACGPEIHIFVFSVN